MKTRHHKKTTKGINVRLREQIYHTEQNKAFWTKIRQTNQILQEIQNSISNQYKQKTAYDN